jgi:hypothetical protein
VITSEASTKIYCHELNAYCCNEQLGIFFFNSPCMFSQVLHLVTCSHKEDTWVKHSDIKMVQYLQSLVAFNRLGCL